MADCARLERRNRSVCANTRIPEHRPHASRRAQQVLEQVLRKRWLRSPAMNAKPNSTSREKPIAWKRSPMVLGQGQLSYLLGAIAVSSFARSSASARRCINPLPTGSLACEQ